jgi:serine/threonine protein kinase
MSPEQCAGTASLTPAADVYSLGIILYEMLTGASPFTGDTPLALALKQVSEAPRPPRQIVPSIPEALERVVLHALAKNPGKRPQDAHELRRELHATAETLGLEHAEPSHSPTLDDLRIAGTESPSGRLLIDLNTLRQVQVATGMAATPLINQTDNTLQDGSSALPKHPAFDRLNISLDRQRTNRRHFVIAAIILVIAILGSGLLVARWWRGQEAGVAAQASPTPTPTAEPTPTPSPAPTPLPAQGKKEPRPRTEKPSTLKKVINKIKKILP